MMDESDDFTQTRIVDGDRRESQYLQAATDSTGDAPVGKDRWRVLANRRRRDVLHCLKISTTPMALADVANALVHWETDVSPSAVQEIRERVYVSLYHTHLPKLAEVDLVAFDIDQKLVDLREEADDLPHAVVRPRSNEYPGEAN